MDGQKDERPWRIRKAGEEDREALEAVVMEAFSVYLPRMNRNPVTVLGDDSTNIRYASCFLPYAELEVLFENGIVRAEATYVLLWASSCSVRGVERLLALAPHQ